MKSKSGNGIKSWPASERPRELLLEQGPEAVSDAGLIAILLQTGVKGIDAVALGRELLKQFGGLSGLLKADQNDLRKVKGLGNAKIAQLLAATEITKRQLREEIIGKTIINGPEDVMEYLSVSMANLKEEVFKVIYLDQSNAVLTVEDLFEGTVDQAVVYPRKVIKRAFELNASGLIFVHNHPAGDLKPSEHDKEITTKLVESCRAVDLTPLDHIIVNHAHHFSFADNNLI